MSALSNTIMRLVVDFKEERIIAASNKFRSKLVNNNYNTFKADATIFADETNEIQVMADMIEEKISQMENYPLLK